MVGDESNAGTGGGLNPRSLYFPQPLRRQRVGVALMGSVLVISASAPQLTEGFITTQAMALRRAGWTVTLGHGAAESPGTRAGDFSLVTAPLNAPSRPRTLFTRARKLVETAIRRNREPASVEDLAAWKAVVRGVDPDVLLLHFGPTAARLLPLLKEINIPWVVQFHGFDVTQLSRHWGYRLTLRSIVSSANAVFACSAFLAREIMHVTGPRADERIAIVTPGYDERVFVPRETMARADGEGPIQLVSVGRLVEVKGHHLVLEALSRCRSDVRLTIIGDGQCRSELASRVERLGLQSRVAFLGGLPQCEVVRNLAQAEIFVQASTVAANGAREGLGLSPIEAAATGLPVIVTNSGGLSETCLQGKTGLIVEDGDVAALSEAIDRLAGAPEERGAMGANGADFAAKTYSSEVQARAAGEIFRRLISARRPPA